MLTCTEKLVSTATTHITFSRLMPESRMAEKQAAKTASSSSKLKDTFKTRDPGWSSMKSTSLFRAVNFELYARPNKYVMTAGAVIFTSCISYIIYMNMTDNSKHNTYVTLDADGGTTSRPRTSKWH